MGNWLAGWAGLVLGFGGLVFVHELGHFILAKWNGVRVYVFSLGMGPYIFSFPYRGTVYVLSLIPIGGYVKMMGQDDMNPNVAPSRDRSDYRNKRPGQKAAILAAGAIFNILFAVAAFTLCYWRGITVDPPRLGNIAPDTPLARAVLHPKDKGIPAKLHAGDRILEVNGVPVKTFIEAVLQVSSSPRDQDLYLKTDRYVELVVVTTQHDKAFGASSIGLSKYMQRMALPLGFTTENHLVIAFNPRGKDTRDLPAAKAGLRKGDVILKIADPTNPAGPKAVEPKDSDDFINAVRGSGGRTLDLTIMRKGKELSVPITPVKPEMASTYQVGARLDMRGRVSKIDPACAAYAAGLREGCQVFGFDPDDVNTAKWTRGTLVWRKTGKDKAPQLTRLEVPASSELVFTQRWVPPERLQAESLGAGGAMAWDDTLRYSSVMFSILRSLVTGDVDTKTLSGPIGIGGSIFTVASSQTFLSFLWWLGFISLNFGVFQFLPIPLLDGWHLVMTFVEKVKGSPVPIRIQEAFQYVGLFLVGALMILATKNDIGRFFK